MLLYRITHKKWSQSFFASGLEGRWNREGNKVIYCAESITLAFLENMVRRQGIGFNHDFKIMFIDVPHFLEVSEINADELEEGWRDVRDYTKCQQAGNHWYEKGRVPIFKMPSAVLPQAYNYVINTMHPEYSKIRLIQITDLVPDERIEEILKQYAGEVE